MQVVTFGLLLSAPLFRYEFGTTYLIVRFARTDGASLDIGFTIRPTCGWSPDGTIASGLLYQWSGLEAVWGLVSSNRIRVSHGSRSL